MTDIKQVADAADMIVNGYAFTRCTEGYRVLNLNRPDRATVFSKEGDALETSMDDIEVAHFYYKQDVKLYSEALTLRHTSRFPDLQINSRPSFSYLAVQWILPGSPP